MSKKSIFVSLLAAGALLLLIGSSVARCTLINEDDAQGSSQSASAETQAASEELSFANYKNSSWTAEDGSSALSVIEGALVEREGDLSKVTYYSVEGESYSNGVLTVAASVSATPTSEQTETVIQITTTPSAARLVCDALGSAYVLDAPKDMTVTLIGATEELYAAFGKSSEDFEYVLSEHAKAKSPHATQAVWDCQVWIDFAAGTYLTNFTLNDTAATIVTVTLDKSGKLSAT